VVGSIRRVCKWTFGRTLGGLEMGAKLLQSFWGLSIFAWVCRMVNQYVEVSNGSAFAATITLVTLGCTLILAPWFQYLKGSDEGNHEQPSTNS
jgi:hypothetical protein